MKTCKSPTTNTPSDLRHPWSRKTFSLCRHKTKGRLPLQRRGPGLRKFQISRAFHFESHRVLTKEQGKISLCLTKTISACGLVEFFWLSFVSSLCLWNLNTFQSFRNKHCVLCKQPGHILILIHTMADTWSLKYFRVLLKNYFSVFLNKYFSVLLNSISVSCWTCPCCQTSRKHPRHLSLSDAIIAKASTGRSVPTIVIADTKRMSTRRVLIHGTNVRLPSLSERTYQPEYCKNMLFPTLVIYVTMLVTFAAMAWIMNCTFITFLALNHINDT